MANLVSPGTSVTITDESFFVPASATTVALFFLATVAEKTNPTGGPALGTYEYDIIRTVTSTTQSGELYGAPTFLKDSRGQHLHGDARNEYGLLALNNYLGVASMAYVVRANINLDDTIEGIRGTWDQKLIESSYILENLANNYLSVWNSSRSILPIDPDYRTTINKSELESLATQALRSVWEFSSFVSLNEDFFDDHTTRPLEIYTNGYELPVTGQYIGFVGDAIEWENNGEGTYLPEEWSPTEAGAFLLSVGDEFKYTREFRTKTSLGANDAARRAAIVTALKKTINSNDSIRSEAYEYSLIMCPGYYEVVSDLVGLNQDIEEEAFIIADTPMDLDADQVVEWANTSARVASPYVAYYYPNALTTNQFTGETVFGAASGVISRTYAYSDNMSEVWFAPAGTTRGLVANVTYMGYVVGELGTATQVVELALNRGQKDNLYKYYTNINPVTFIPGRGIIIMGQKTSSPNASAMDRVNVVRMMCYIRRSLRKSLLPFLFQPNDQITRDSVKAMGDGFLADIMTRRGLYDYATQCDTGNNTPARIDRNELWLDVAVAPMKSVEFIMVPIRIVNTGASM